MGNFFTSQWRDIAGNVKFWVLTAVLGGSVTLMTILTHGLTRAQQGGLASVFSIPLIWAIVATVMSLRSDGKAATNTITQVSTNTSAGQFQDVEAFYRTYDNSMLRETEDAIRATSDKYQPGPDREKFLIRLFASGVLIYLFDMIWFTIFQSQIKALEELNRRALTINEIRSFYDGAAANNPSVFQTYPFESWLTYMRSWLLILQGDSIQITIRGKEFLKYLIQKGHAASDRRN